MTGRPSVDDRALAAWRMRSLGLTEPGFDSLEGVVDALLAVQAENPAQSRWALGSRTDGVDDGAVRAAVDEGALLRTHVLRPTWHYVRPADIGWLLDLTGPRIRMSMRSLDAKIGLDDPALLTKGIDAILGQLSTGQHLTRDALAERLEQQGLPGRGQELGHLLAHAETLALICSGVSNDGVHTYAPLDQRAPKARRLDRDEALQELAVRYVRSHGPVTDRDLSYWASLPLGAVRQGLASASETGHITSFEHDGRTWWVDVAQSPPDGASTTPRGHVLQRLDEVHNGVQDTRHLLDLAGLVTSGRQPVGMVMVDTQIVGNMRRRATTTTLVVEIELLRSLTQDETAQVEKAAGRYARFLDLEAEVRSSGPSGP